MDSWCQRSDELVGRAVIFIPHSRDHEHPRISCSRLQKWAAKPKAKQQLSPGAILNSAQPKGKVSSLWTRGWALQLLFQPHFPKQPLGRVPLLHQFSSFLQDACLHIYLTSSVPLSVSISYNLPSAHSMFIFMLARAFLTLWTVISQRPAGFLLPSSWVLEEKCTNAYF